MSDYITSFRRGMNIMIIATKKKKFLNNGISPSRVVPCLINKARRNNSKIENGHRSYLVSTRFFVRHYGYSLKNLLHSFWIECTNFFLYCADFTRTLLLDFFLYSILNTHMNRMLLGYVITTHWKNINLDELWLFFLIQIRSEAYSWFFPLP